MTRKGEALLEAVFAATFSFRCLKSIKAKLPIKKKNKTHN